MLHHGTPRYNMFRWTVSSRAERSTTRFLAAYPSASRDASRSYAKLLTGLNLDYSFKQCKDQPTHVRLFANSALCARRPQLEQTVKRTVDKDLRKATSQQSQIVEALKVERSYFDRACGCRLVVRGVHLATKRTPKRSRYLGGCGRNWRRRERSWFTFDLRFDGKRGAPKGTTGSAQGGVSWPIRN